MAHQLGSTFVIKADIPDTDAGTFEFTAHKTMYGGKQISKGDTIFLIASEKSGGWGLFARGIVESVVHVAKNSDVQRQTPRVSVEVRRLALATRPLGRIDLKAFSKWKDCQPQTELNFKLYRQSTNKIVGISALTAAFLEEFF